MHPQQVCRWEIGGMIDRLDDCTAIQGYLNWLEKWSDRNLVKFSSWKCKVTNLRLNKCRQQAGGPGWNAVLLKRTWESHWMPNGIWDSMLWTRTWALWQGQQHPSLHQGELGVRSLVKGKSKGNLINIYKYQNGVRKKEPDYTLWYPLERQKAISINRNTENSI